MLKTNALNKPSRSMEYLFDFKGLAFTPPERPVISRRQTDHFKVRQ